MMKFRQIRPSEFADLFKGADIRHVKPTYSFICVGPNSTMEDRLEVRVWLRERFGQNNHYFTKGDISGYYFTNRYMFTFEEPIGFEFKMRWC